MSLTIGDVTLENNLILAPMAGFTDLPFRLLCKEMGAGLVCMEMISAKALHYKDKKTAQLLQIDEREMPVSLQLFGSDPDIISEQAKAIEEHPYAFLDINMGCPVPKIVNNGEGSALMKNPVLVGKIVESTVKATKKPVTVKIRKGFDENHVNAVEIARVAQESGASAVAVHGRTRNQMYSGEADWSIIADVKAALSIPVIGNGDITCAEDVLRMKEQTGCDGFMVGRGARGNPWIFSQILDDLAGREVKKPTPEEMKEMLLRHATMLCEYKGDYIGIREMRTHAAFYTAGYRGSSKLRGRLGEIESIDQLRGMLDEYLLSM